MNRACLESLSTTTRMAVKPEEFGSCSMKSIKMEFHGFSGTGNCLSSPYGLWRGVLARAHEVQDWT